MRVSRRLRGLARGGRARTPSHVAWLLGASLALAAALEADAHAQSKPPPDAELGTVEVTGAATTALPKLALVPEDADAAAVLRQDLDRLGSWDVADDLPFDKDTPLDAKTFKGKGLSYVVRVRKDGADLAGDAWIVGKGDDPIVKHAVPLSLGSRRAAHRLADKLVSALTGRAGPFESRLAFTRRTKLGRQVFTSDVDGHDEVALGRPEDTALSPAFGPGGAVYYAVSKDYDPFRLVVGPKATEVAIGKAGSVLAVSFSPDRTQLALAVMRDEQSKLYRGNADGSDLAPIEAPKLPNRPVLGPLGKFAFVASGGGTQRVYVDGHPVSPAGFHASAPTFCDSPQGLLVVFTVGVGSGADLVATDTSGGGLRRLTQGHGSNAYPACSPDGRLVAFFSTGSSGKTPGLYALPIANPGRIRRWSDAHGESLAWAR